MREGFDAHLTNYLGGITPSLPHDARRTRFMDFIRETLGVPVPEYKIEEPLVFQPGFIDALLGNLVFEFKKGLLKETEDAEGKLRKYLTDLRARMPQATFTAVATDGVRFQVYFPVFEGIELKDLGAPVLQWQLKADAPQEAHNFLESLFFVYRTTRRTPTAADIVAHLGPHSPTFARFHGEISRLFQGSQRSPSVEVRFQEWCKYLVRVYGEDVGNEPLFLKHTYLSAIARFTGFLFLFPPAALADQEIEGIIRGSYFSQRGLQNFGEDDFFTWVLQPPAGRLGLGLMRRLGSSLEVYDFSTAKQDLLKELYEELLGQEARHNLGEYYTPDWLAEYILTKMVKLPDNPNWRLLDPACGSGTFLFIALRLLREALENLGVPRDEVLTRLCSQVVGIDVHPVAVIIARTNYLLALGDLVKPHPPFPLSIPVYLSDSLRLVEVARKETTRHPEDLYEIKAEGGVLEVPGSLADSPSLLDEAVEAMRGLLPHPRDSALRGYDSRLQELQEKKGLTPFAREILLKDMDFLLRLYLEGKDTVWLYFLKNLPRPRFLERQPFDLVAGNPPWLSLRYIGDPDYTDFLRREWLRTYGLLRGRQAHLFFHIDTSALFFAKAADLYLKREGLIAFVMPRGVFTASQYATFTSFDFLGDRSVVLGLQEVVDLAPEAHQRVEPLFRQAACVLVARKGPETQYPVPATRLWGELPERNLALSEAEKHLNEKSFRMERTLSGRLVPLRRGRKPAGVPGKSPYYDRVFEGATIVPRSLFFVRAESSPPTLPLLVTDPQVQEKPPWKGIRLRGQVEPEFIYATLLGGDILPFGHRPLRPIVLPLMVENDSLQHRKPALIKVDRAVEMGKSYLADWLKEAKGYWQARARKGADGKPKIPTLLHELNLRNNLLRQQVWGGVKVLYNKSGTDLSACVIDLGSLPLLKMGPFPLPPAGFAADCMTFYYDATSLEEGHYLSAVLNSPYLDGLIKQSQPRGLFGERHIHRLPFEFPIPAFEAGDPQHLRLAELAQQCQEKVAAALPDLLGKYKGSGHLRGKVRELLAPELREIDRLVKRLLK